MIAYIHNTSNDQKPLKNTMFFRLLLVVYGMQHYYKTLIKLRNKSDTH